MLYNVFVYCYIIISWIKEIKKIMWIRKVIFFLLMILLKMMEFFFIFKILDKIEIVFIV